MDRKSSNLCRTCLETSPKLTELSKTISLDNECHDLYGILEKCTGLKIISNRNISDGICRDCVVKLSKAFSFRKQVWEADAFFTVENIQESIDEAEIELPQEIVEMIEDPLEVPETQSYEILYEEVADTDENIFRISTEIKEEQDTSNDVPASDDEESPAPNENKPYSRLCPICGTVSKTYAKYLYHVQTHFPRKQEVVAPAQEHKCYDCGRTYTNRYNLQSHRKLHDPNNKNKCDVCGRLCIDAAALRSHKIIHLEEKPFKCSICGKGTINQRDLNTHMRFHTGERPYQCNLCEKSFITLSHCRYHERMHGDSSSIKFSCEICQKQYKSKKLLRNHLKIHDEDKHVKCEFCDLKFAVNKQRLKHLRTHEEYKGFSCETCGKNFVQHVNFENHVRICSTHINSMISSDN